MQSQLAASSRGRRRICPRRAVALSGEVDAGRGTERRRDHPARHAGRSPVRGQSPRATGKVSRRQEIPRKWANFLDFRAAYVEPPQPGSELPAVRLTLPNGTSLTSSQADLPKILQLLGCRARRVAGLKRLRRHLAPSAAERIFGSQPGCWSVMSRSKRQADCGQLRSRLRHVEPPQPGSELPAVRLTLPDGTSLTSSQADLPKILSAALGREVTFAEALQSGDSPGTTAEEYWPRRGRPGPPRHGD